MIVTCTLLFSKFDVDVRKDVLNAAGRDGVSKDRLTGLPNGPQRAMIDLEYMKSIVELVKGVDDQNKPAPMDLGSFAEAHDHTPSTSSGMTTVRRIGPRMNGHQNTHSKTHSGKMVTPTGYLPLPRPTRPSATP